jgi:ribosomal protein S18 acetylase RimI-like enzyme
MVSDRMVAVSELEEPTPEALEAFVRLLPQLSSSARPLTADELAEMVRSDASHILLVRDDADRIVGTMTLVVFRIPTGVRAWIEDVVVDEEARGTGAGEALNRAAIELAHSLGARTIDLTSRPSRVAANALYRKLGFEERQTNIYRHNPEHDAVTRDA